MTNIILCGGSGTRLWPISRKLMPKQFIKIFNNKSLFELTVERNAKVCDKNMIVLNDEQYFLALDQLEENPTFLLEPVGRNTAPAIALACIALGDNELVLVTPSDYLIKDEIEYKKALEIAKKLANKDSLVTFGIKPTFAETGFGYIQAKPENDECSVFNVELFHEKPDLATAQKYVENNSKFNTQNSKLFLWNSGMFMFKVGVFLDELKKYSPLIYKASIKAYDNSKKGTQIKISYDDMINIPEDSIDYAVLEKSSKVKVVPLEVGWSDVGSFDALAKELPNDENNNFIISDKLVKTIDIKDSIIIDTGDALLVSKKGSSQKVKEIVNALKKEESKLPNIHLTGFRPWGTYTVLEDSDGYKIKRIVVEPHKRLSLQKHKYRNEHWVVVSGAATVTINDKTFALNQNESTYIKAGDKHRLANNTDNKLVIIEVQAGSYTGEDDIIRLEDDYERN